jgi:16S rRNA (uracil1498-N3)-methyltransferase
MGRQQVRVQIGRHDPVERECAVAVTLALGMPANERMDWLVEKATELGVAAIRPLVTERSVLRLAGERAERKQAHWQAIAVAAAEQCGRTRVPVCTRCAPGPTLDALPSPCPRLGAEPCAGAAACARRWPAPAASCSCSAAPKGAWRRPRKRRRAGARAAPLSLGPRVLRAETAPLAALAWLDTA